MYADWVLTSAQGGTFVEVEMGIEAKRVTDRVFDRAMGGAYFRRWTTSRSTNCGSGSRRPRGLTARS